ncbi:MAG TPA: hypothetical protein VI758_13890 [Bacteroidota bacterium]
MSLKAFHIVFIALSIVTAFFFGTWLLVTVEAAAWSLRLSFGIVSYAVGLALIFYGRYFLRRFKHISFI